MKSNEQALQLAVEYCSEVDDGQHLLILDLDYTILAASRVIHEIYNVAAESIIGRNILEFVNKKLNRISLLGANLEKVLIQKDSITFLTVRFTRRKDYRLAIVSYSPIINRSTGDVVGFKSSTQKSNIPIRLYSLPRILTNTTNSVNNQNEPSDKFLTNVEHEILYLTFQCDNYQEIALLLSLAHREEISRAKVAKIVLRNLYTKFNVLNLEALKDKAHELGYHKNVPTSLFGEFVYPLDKL